MSTVSAKFTSVSATLNSTTCANGNYCSSTVIDNSSSLYEDFLIDVTFQLASGGSPNNPAYCNVYVAFSVDGSNYSDQASIASSTANGSTPSYWNSKLAAINQSATGAASSYGRCQFNIARLLGGAPPYKFFVWMVNQTGLTLQSTAITVLGVQHTIA